MRTHYLAASIALLAFWHIDAQAQMCPPPTIHGMVADRDGCIFAATLGVVHRSVDGGNNWMPLGAIYECPGTGVYSADCIAVDGDGAVWVGADEGLYRSRNCGKSWEPVLHPNGKPILCPAGTEGAAATNPSDGRDRPITFMYLALAFSAKGELFCGTNHGLFRLDRAASTWQPVNMDESDPYVGSLTSGSSGILWCGTMKGNLYRSADGGRTWTRAHPPGDSGSLFTKRIDSITTDSAGRVYVLSGRILLSEDGGKEWRDQPIRLPVRRMSGSVLYVAAILALEDGSLLLGGEFHDVNRSTDGGKTWTLIAPWLAGTSASTLVANSHGRIYTVTRPGLMYSEDDGRTWRPTQGSPPEEPIRQLAIDSRDRLYATVGNGNQTPLYRSTDAGLTWTSVAVPWGEGGIDSFSADDDGRLFVSVSKDGFYTTSDGGVSWLKQSVAEDYGYNWIGKDPHGHLVVSIQLELYHSETSGGPWTRVIGRSRPGMTDGERVNKLLGLDGRILAATDSGVHEYTEQDGTWVAAGSEYPFTSAPSPSGVSDITLGRDGSVFAVGSNGLYRSSDCGKSWAKVIVNALDPSVRCLHITGSGAMIVGTAYTGIFRSTDNGKTWKQVYIWTPPK